MQQVPAVGTCCAGQTFIGLATLGGQCRAAILVGWDAVARLLVTWAAPASNARMWLAAGQAFEEWTVPAA